MTIQTVPYSPLMGMITGYRQHQTRYSWPVFAQIGPHQDTIYGTVYSRVARTIPPKLAYTPLQISA
eukprot:scaffold19821_cov166-Skeletonema_marinoi.AAC.6